MAGAGASHGHRVSSWSPAKPAAANGANAASSSGAGAGAATAGRASRASSGQLPPASPSPPGHAAAPPSSLGADAAAASSAGDAPPANVLRYTRTLELQYRVMAARVEAAARRRAEEVRLPALCCPFWHAL